MAAAASKEKVFDIVMPCFFPVINPGELRETLHSKLVTIPRQLDITQTLPSQTPQTQPTF